MNAAGPATSGTFHVYDTTLRDGAQQEGLNLSVADKLAIARHLDELGVGYIEGGWPGANPKDTEFFARARAELRPAQRDAGRLRCHPAARPRPPTTRWCRRCSTAGAQVVTLVAKSHHRHVELALRTTLEENLEMVRDTVSPLRGEGRRVFLDAEHFFDGYRANRDYALEVLRTAAEAGAEVVALCDTNGGMLPTEVADVVDDVAAHHRRRGSASTATTTPAARSPTRWPRSTPAPPTCRERSTGTASAPATPTWSRWWPTSSSSSAGTVLPEGRLRDATRIAHAVAEVTNVPPASRQPYVGVERVRPQGRAARQRDQGRPEPLPAPGPRAGRQRHEAAGLGHGGSREHRAEGAPSSASTSPATRRRQSLRPLHARVFPPAHGRDRQAGRVQVIHSFGVSAERSCAAELSLTGRAGTVLDCSGSSAACVGLR